MELNYISVCDLSFLIKKMLSIILLSRNKTIEMAVNLPSIYALVAGFLGDTV